VANREGATVIRSNGITSFRPLAIPSGLVDDFPSCAIHKTFIAAFSRALKTASLATA
jgi:hypothetical protein